MQPSQSSWAKLPAREIIEAIELLGQDLFPLWSTCEDENGPYVQLQLIPPKDDPLEGHNLLIRYHLKAIHLPGPIYKENQELDTAIRYKLHDIFAYITENESSSPIGEDVPTNCKFAISNKGHFTVYYVTESGKKKQKSFKDFEPPKWWRQNGR